MKIALAFFAFFLAISASAAPYRGKITNNAYTIDGVEQELLPDNRGVLRMSAVGTSRRFTFSIPGTSVVRSGVLPMLYPGAWQLAATIDVYSQPECYAEVFFSITKITNRKVLFNYTENLVCPDSETYAAISGTLRKPRQ